MVPTSLRRVFSARHRATHDHRMGTRISDRFTGQLRLSFSSLAEELGTPPALAAILILYLILIQRRAAFGARQFDSFWLPV